MRTRKWNQLENYYSTKKYYTDQFNSIPHIKCNTHTDIQKVNKNHTSYIRILKACSFKNLNINIHSLLLSGEERTTSLILLRPCSIPAWEEAEGGWRTAEAAPQPGGERGDPAATLLGLGEGGWRISGGTERKLREEGEMTELMGCWTNGGRVRSNCWAGGGQMWGCELLQRGPKITFPNKSGRAANTNCHTHLRMGRGSPKKSEDRQNTI